MISASGGLLGTGALGETINNLVITGDSSTAKAGITITGGTFTIENSLFEGNLYGLEVEGGSGTISGTTFNGELTVALPKAKGSW